MDDDASEPAFFVAEEGAMSTFQAFRELVGVRGLFRSLYRGSHCFRTPEAGSASAGAISSSRTG